MMDYSRKSVLVASSLWAAYGDAIGFITELADAPRVSKRTGGVAHIEFPIFWRRKIGGYGGVTVDLPAGTYSDDTQLRLSTSRAIDGLGRFDAEAFSRIELTTWLNYELGGGLGTKAAAFSFTKSGASWFSNFFKGKADYLRTGGNGAAMRIQPHVWHDFRLGISGQFRTAVFENSIITHGHPRGFCGALFHAMTLDFALRQRRVPDISTCREIAHEMSNASDLIESPMIQAAWRPVWEKRYRKSLREAFRETAAEIDVALQAALELRGRNLADKYRQFVEVLDLRAPSSRGSGTLTSVAAVVLATFADDLPLEEVMIIGANEIGTDTDSICSMCGAVAGAAKGHFPEGIKLQDKDYLANSAIGLHTLETGHSEDSSFNYPNVESFAAVKTQADSIYEEDGALYLAGLGKVIPRADLGGPWLSGDFSWQWLETAFGQTVLAKQRMVGRKVKTGRSTNNVRISGASGSSVISPLIETDLFTEKVRHKNEISDNSKILGGRINLDFLTKKVIDSGFDPEILGHELYRLITRAIEADDDAILNATAFTAIIAKAMVARRGKR